MIHSGCSVYMVHVVDTRRKNQVQLPDVPIVRDFMDMFPKDLPGLSPNREIIFEIELTPCIGPISKAPYKMASAEYKKLDKQLQELLDKGFIRSNFHNGEQQYSSSRRKTNP